MKLYTITEAANPLGIYDQLVRRYCKQGRVEGSTFQDGTWYIPEGTQKPGPLTRKERDQDPEKTPSLLKRILYQKVRNNHYGIYEYLQVNLAYSSSRMASNRMTRVQVRGLYRTDRILDGFEPATVDDVIEVINHFAAIDTVLDTIHDTITQAYCKSCTICSPMAPTPTGIRRLQPVPIERRNAVPTKVSTLPPKISIRL